MAEDSRNMFLCMKEKWRGRVKGPYKVVEQVVCDV